MGMTKEELQALIRGEVTAAVKEATKPASEKPVTAADVVEIAKATFAELVKAGDEAKVKEKKEDKGFFGSLFNFD